MESKVIKKNKIQEWISSFLFILPYLVFFTMFALVPFVMSITLSFCSWDGISEIEWVGFKNYLMLFGAVGTGQIAKDFWEAILHTLLFVIVQTPICIVLPLMVALLINRCKKVSKVFMAFFYFPSLLSIATVGIIWNFLLDANAGVINTLFGGETPWLTSQPYAWISIFLLSTWWGIGGNMVLYIAGLANVPKDCIEAASIDGAGAWKSFIHITVPSMRFTFIYTIIMTTLSSFNVFGQPDILTPGNKSTMVAMMSIYNTGYGGGKFGRACAMSIIMGLIMISFSVVSYKIQMKDAKGEK